jgi:hypothetical protein
MRHSRASGIFFLSLTLFMYSVSRSLQRSVINPARLNQQMAMIYALNYVKICFAIPGKFFIYNSQISYFIDSFTVRLYLPLLNREFDRITYSPRYHKHLKRLTAWATFSAQPSSVESTGGHDLCEDLLRNSR